MTKSLPSLRSLRVFEAVARNLSFREAADELCVTHSAVSHQVKLLEEKLGGPLFHRKGRSISLSEDGQHLYPIVRESFANIAEAVDQIRFPRESTTLKIHTYMSFGTIWLIPKLNDFHRRYPEIRVRISVSFVDVNFEKDDANIGIIMGAETLPHWTYEYLFDMTIFPVCSPDLLSTSSLKTPEDLKGQRMFNIELATDDWKVWLKAAGLDENLCDGGPIVDNYLQALESVYNGEGIVIARKALAARDLAMGRLVRPFDLSVPEPGSWFMVYPREQKVTKEIDLFKNWLLEQARLDENVIVREPGETQVNP